MEKDEDDDDESVDPNLSSLNEVEQGYHRATRKPLPLHDPPDQPLADYLDALRPPPRPPDDSICQEGSRPLIPTVPLGDPWDDLIGGTTSPLLDSPPPHPPEFPEIEVTDVVRLSPIIDPYGDWGTLTCPVEALTRHPAEEPGAEPPFASGEYARPPAQPPDDSRGHGVEALFQSRSPDIPINELHDPIDGPLLLKEDLLDPHLDVPGDLMAWFDEMMGVHLMKHEQPSTPPPDLPAAPLGSDGNRPSEYELRRDAWIPHGCPPDRHRAHAFAVIGETRTLEAPEDVNEEMPLPRNPQLPSLARMPARGEQNDSSVNWREERDAHKRKRCKPSRREQASPAEIEHDDASDNRKLPASSARRRSSELHAEEALMEQWQATNDPRARSQTRQPEQMDFEMPSITRPPNWARSGTDLCPALKRTPASRRANKRRLRTAQRGGGGSDMIPLLPRLPGLNGEGIEPQDMGQPRQGAIHETNTRHHPPVGQGNVDTQAARGLQYHAQSEAQSGGEAFHRLPDPQTERDNARQEPNTRKKRDNLSKIGMEYKDNWWKFSFTQTTSKHWNRAGFSQSISLKKKNQTFAHRDVCKEILVQPETSTMLAEASFQPIEQQEDEEDQTQDRIIEVSRSTENNTETAVPGHSNSDNDPESNQEGSREVLESSEDIPEL